MADERERITVKPRNQNAGEGGNLRGRGNSAGAGVRYTERPLSKAGPDCVGRVRVRESGTPPNLDEGPITPLRQAQQAQHLVLAIVGQIEREEHCRHDLDHA